MKLVKVNELREKDVIAEAIMSDDFQILLGKGTILKADYIEKLKELDIKEVYIEGGLKTEDELQIETSLINHDCAEKVKSALKYYIFDKEEQLSEIKQEVDVILSDILSNPKVIENVCEIKERKPDLYEHTISLCLLSMMTALHMDIEKEDIRQLGTAALLHDLGLRYTTVDYENKELSALSEENQEEYKKHTVYGYSAIADVKWLTDQEKQMILHHHENLSGNGYPFHKEKLSLLTQILSVCEMMDEMLAGIGHEKKKVWEILSYLSEIKGILYEEKIIDTIQGFIASYPHGTKVELNDGSIGIVVNQSQTHSLKPTIQLIKTGSITKEIEPGSIILIHLDRESELSIVNALEH